MLDILLSNAARSRLAAFGWPGNVRQLKSAISRIVILAAPGHEVRADELELDDVAIAGTLVEELEQVERQKMAEALTQASGVRSEAARALGMARTTFITKMKRYGLR